MGDLNLNWDEILKEQADDSAGTVLPEGDYDIKVVSAEATRASTGSPMIKLTCDVTSGPFESRRLWTNIVLKSDSPGAMRVSLKKLSGLGVSREWLAENNPSIDMIAKSLIGNTAAAKVIQRTWNDQQRNDIDMFKLASGTPSAPQVPETAMVKPAANDPAPF